MNQFNAPTKLSWWIALGLGIVALVASLITIPFFTDAAPWIALIGLALMLAATKLTKL